MIMEKETSTPKYQFLYQTESPEHHFYRWRIFSLLQGDTEDSWRTAPFQMTLNGPTWVPPPKIKKVRLSKLHN